MARKVAKRKAVAGTENEDSTYKQIESVESNNADPPLPDEPIPEETDVTQPPLPDEPVPSVDSNDPPLPDEQLPENHATDPPLPDEPVPTSIDKASTVTPTSQPSAPGETVKDDGWTAIMDPVTQKYYFYNRHTKQTTWDNPRTTDHSTSMQSGSTDNDEHTGSTDVAFQARFDKRTGKFISDPNRSVENYTPEARAARQMSHFFDPTALDDGGVSKKAERRALKHSKEEMKLFKQKQKEKREHKRRAWLTKD